MVNYGENDKQMRKEMMRAERSKVDLPEHHFYDNREKLLSLLQQEEDFNTYKGAECNPYEELTAEEV